MFRHWKMLVALSIAFVATAADASAQVRIGVGVGTRGYGGYGGTRYYGNPGFGYRPGYYGSGFGYNSFGGYPYYPYNRGSGIVIGFGFSNGGYYGPGSYYSPGGYYSSPPIIYSQPRVIVGSAPATYVPFSASISPVSAAPAQVDMVVPEGAQVWFDGVLNEQTGTNRQYVSKELTASQPVQVKIKYNLNGQETTREISMPVRPGEKSSIDLSALLR